MRTGADTAGMYRRSRMRAALAKRYRPHSCTIDLGNASAAMSGGIAFTRGSQIGCGSCHGAGRAVVHVP